MINNERVHVLLYESRERVSKIPVLFFITCNLSRQDVDYLISWLKVDIVYPVTFEVEESIYACYLEKDGLYAVILRLVC